jgi:ATP-binding protein involved in chromosome partitioning
MDIFGRGGGERLAKEAGVPFIGAIPIEATVREGGDDGNPVVVAKPDSVAAQALRSVAEDIAAKLSVAAYNQSNFVPINLVG